MLNSPQFWVLMLVLVSTTPLHEYSNGSINENRAGWRLQAPRYAWIWVWSIAAGGYTHIRMWCGGISALGSFSERSLFFSFLSFFILITLYVWNGSVSSREHKCVVNKEVSERKRTEVWNRVGFLDPLELISSVLKESFNKPVLMNHCSGIQYRESLDFNAW